ETALADPMFAVLAASDLADELELVKFTPSPLNLEELSKLWSVFFQTPYHLSVAYQGSVVFIESDDRPQPTLPVLERDAYVIPVAQPVIDEIASDAGPRAPIVATDTLILMGKRLRADAVTVLVGGVTVTPQPADISTTRISIPLPSGLQSGVVAVQVVQSMMMGRPPVPHHVAESNVAAFVLHPTIAPGPVTSSLVTLTVSPPVVQGQRLVLLLNERATTAPASYSFIAKQPATSSTVQISISGVKAAEYFVRLQVDGAESPVDLDPNSLKFGPKVTVP
ncbi:MAG TPA: Pvc16 family protein, partial [Albitalea sp.]|nr:Pvc16 family protein [Albitalea sp.]